MSGGLRFGFCIPPGKNIAMTQKIQEPGLGGHDSAIFPTQFAVIGFLERRGGCLLGIYRFIGYRQPLGSLGSHFFQKQLRPNDSLLRMSMEVIVTIVSKLGKL